MVGGPRRQGINLLRHGQSNGGAEAAFNAIGKHHVAAVAADNGTHDGQSQARTAAFAAARRFDPVESRKNLLQFVFRNAGSFVLNNHGESVAFCRQRHLGHAAIFDRVVDKVDEGPFQRRRATASGKRKGKRGRGAAGKIPVFGLLKRGGKVYTKIIPDASSATLMPIIKRKVVPDSIVYSDGWKGYNVLDVSDFHHFRINHSELFADDQTHINGIENFWNQAKRHMRKFNGVPKAHFGLFLKQCEWRFNNSDPSIQLAQLRQWVRKNMG